MRGGNQLVWKLSLPAILIVGVVIVGTGLAGTRLSRHFALESAGALLEFNSVSLRGAIDKLMMSRNNRGASELLKDVFQESAVYRDVSLISHPEGKVFASGILPAGTHLAAAERACQMCHVGAEVRGATSEPLNAVTTAPDGTRSLEIVTPILNKPTCQTANCHVHANSPPLLGFLKTEYSLAAVDSLQTTLSSFMVGAALMAVILGTGALFVAFRRILDRPLRGLVAGLSTLATNELDFRFHSKRTDEIGLVERSFDSMADRIQAEQERLREAREYLEAIVENSADLIITVSPEGLIRTFNRGAEEALGYDRKEVIGRPIEMLFRDPRERGVAIGQLHEGDNVTNYATRFLNNAGETRDVLLTLSRLRDAQGNAIGTLGISKDVTREKRLQQELLETEQSAAVGRAVTGAQRVVLNMLTTIRRGLYAIRIGRKNRNDQLTNEGYGLIEAGLERITDLAQQMLRYSHNWRIERTPIDPAVLAARIVTAVKQRAEDQATDLRTEVHPHLPAVSCDPRLLHMVLLDLVTNSLDACEARDYPEHLAPEVVLRVTQPSNNGGMTIEVQDNGVGMEKEILDNLFTPFFSTKSKKSGTGLGLALAARIIEMHGGQISVESKPDSGTTFRITIPLNLASSSPSHNSEGGTVNRPPSH